MSDKVADGETGQQIGEAAEFIRATYQALLRREPEPGVLERMGTELANGSWTYAKYLRSIRGSREFASKWEARDPGTRSDESKYVDPMALWTPGDLSLTMVNPRRLLIVGSCLSEAIRTRLKGLKTPCESDLYFAGTDLPASPEQPIADYDFQIVQLGLRHILPDASFARLADPDEDGHERLFARACGIMRRHFGQSMQWNRELGLLTFVFGLVEPMQNPVGRLQPPFDLRNPAYFVRKLNETLASEVAAYANAYFVDVNLTFSFFGRRFVQDDLVTGFNHGSFIGNFDAQYDQDRLEPAGIARDHFESKTDEAFNLIWSELIARFRTVRQLDQVKLVVIDLDDTLWRGVIADLDLDALPPMDGWPVGLLEALLILKRRGILLAIISKNDEARVLEAWPKILRGRLSLDDFAISRINWRPKPENMADILGHLNLSPRNVLYIDDNPVERAGIKGAFPEIRMLGGSPLHWRRILLWSAETQVATITSESVARTEMVQAQVAREKQRQVMPREEFLASLNVSMNFFEIEDANHSRFPRALELINKTNQFNTTGKRWTREECVAAFAAGKKFYAFEVSDHYTEYGLVGVVIVDQARISQFVMSCRVMGLDAEIAAISQIGASLRDKGALIVSAAMVETERNQPCRNLYAGCGFQVADGGWQRNLTDWPTVPKHISLKVESLLGEDVLAKI